MKNQKSVFAPVARLALTGLLLGTLAMPLAASARVRRRGIDHRFGQGHGR